MGRRAALVGRERETALLSDFLVDGTAGGLVLTGEAGRGKTALWEHAADLAAGRGALVLRATPGEGEERHSFAVLQDLFRDVELDVLALREPVRHALMVALLRDHAESPVDAQAVNVGVLEVLDGLAGDREVVVFVDDVQWADAASLESLTYAARRLSESSVRYLLARRAGFDRTALEATLVRRALVDVEPEPLTAEDTARLLRQELGLTLNPRVLRVVREQTGGNPLFVLEVGRALRDRGVAERGEPLDLPSEIASVLGLRVRDLPPDQRTLLLAVALDPHLTEADLVELAGLDAVETAVAERVISMTEGGRVRAWHPMLAAAAREAATPGRRRELHGRLADVVASPERRLRHRALVSTEGDDLLAGDLSAAAATAGDRGAAETALELAELALARTPTGSPARIGRVLDLASRLASAGEAQRLTDMLGPEVEQIPHGPERGRALLMLLDGMWGSVDYAERLVERVLDECGDDRDVRSRALEVKSVIAAGIRVSGVAAARAWADEAMALSDHDHSEWRNLSDAANWCLVHSGRPPRPPEGPAYWKRLIWRGEMAEAERLVREAVSAAEAGGRYQEATILTVSLSDVLVRSGRIDEARAFAAAQEDLDLTARETPDVELLRAEIEVRYGDAAAAREWAGLALDGADELGHVWIRLEADRALAMADLQSGEPEAAAGRLREVLDHAVSSGVREPGMFPVAPELIEALVLLGHTEEARAVLDWLDEVSVEQAHPWGLAMGARGRVLVGLADGTLAPAEAASTIDAVAADLVALGLAHDAARAHLVVGSALRRQRQWGYARDHLARAVELFESLGAAGWVQTTRGELDRVGGRRPTADGALSAAELETARLASEGMPNKAIARQLQVSVSTVEAHLTKAYAKLGVRSRAQLAVRLEELGKG